MSFEDMPKWKRELLEKKQLWKTVGGWSVPPVAYQRGSSQNLKTQEPNMVSSTSKPERLANGSGKYSNGSMDDLSSVSVAELKSKFQSDVSQEVFPMVKARSAENILDDKPPAYRRASTTFNFGINPKFTTPAVRKTSRDGPKMEDFLKKYRRTPSRKISTVSNADLTQHQRERKTSWKKSDSPVYFLDMNENELPPPNTVYQTVEVFEDPDKSRNDTPTSPTELVDVTCRARDVVQKFEAQIKNGSDLLERPVPKPRAALNGIKPSPTPKPNFAVLTKRAIIKNSQ